MKNFIGLLLLCCACAFADEVPGTFFENLKKLEIPDEYTLKEIVIGKPNAPHTVVIYSSFSCSHCRRFHAQEFPKLKSKYVDSGNIKVYLRNYIDDLAALESAILMRILYEEKKDVMFFYKIIFDQQEMWLKSQEPRKFLKQIFVSAGYAPHRIDELLNEKNSKYKRVSAGLMKEQQRAMHQFGIKAAPAFVIDGMVHEGFLTCDAIAEKCNLKKQ